MDPKADTGRPARSVKVGNDAANAAASALSFSVGYFAVNFDAVGGGRGNLSKDPIELALMGNKVGEVVTADGSGGDSWAALVEVIGERSTKALCAAFGGEEVYVALCDRALKRDRRQVPLEHRPHE